MSKNRVVTLDRHGNLKVSEKAVRGQIREYLKVLGVKWWWNHQGLGSYKGLPDLEGVHKGRHFYIEVKAPTGKLREGQQDFKDMVEEENETVFVPHSFEEFEQAWNAWTKEVQ